MHTNSLKSFFYMTITRPKVISKFILFLLLMCCNFTFAQTPPPPFDDDVDDQLPIDSHVVILLVLGVVLGYAFLKKNEKVPNATKQ